MENNQIADKTPSQAPTVSQSNHRREQVLVALNDPIAATQGIFPQSPLHQSQAEASQHGQEAARVEGPLNLAVMMMEHSQKVAQPRQLQHRIPVRSPLSKEEFHVQTVTVKREQNVAKQLSWTQVNMVQKVENLLVVHEVKTCTRRRSDCLKTPRRQVQHHRLLHHHPIDECQKEVTKH